MSRLRRKVDRFAQLKDVYESVGRTQTICSYLGLVMVEVKIENGRKIYKITRGKILRSSLMLIIYIMGLVVICLHKKFPPWANDVSEMVKQVNYYFCALTASMAVIFASLFSKRLIFAFLNIEKVDKTLPSLAIFVPPTSYRRNLTGIVIVETAIAIGYIVILALLISLTVPKTINESRITMDMVLFVTEIVFTCLYIMTILMMSMQYVQFLTLIRNRYATINDHLEALISQETNATTNNALIENLTLSRVVLKQMQLLQHFDPVSKVRTLMDLHVRLSETAITFNNYFAVQHLVEITSSFLSIVVGLFEVGSNFSNPNSTTNTANINLTLILWAINNSLSLWLLVHIASATCDEGNKCPRILHKIRNVTKNHRLQSLIEMHSLQMYANRLQFDVCGLFPLDYTLLQTIVAGVTTYLVILIQFKNTG